MTHPTLGGAARRRVKRSWTVNISLGLGRGRVTRQGSSLSSSGRLSSVFLRLSKRLSKSTTGLGRTLSFLPCSPSVGVLEAMDRLLGGVEGAFLGASWFWCWDWATPMALSAACTLAMLASIRCITSRGIRGWSCGGCRGCVAGGAGGGGGRRE